MQNCVLRWRDFPADAQRSQLNLACQLVRMTSWRCTKNAELVSCAACQLASMASWNPNAGTEKIASKITFQVPDTLLDKLKA